MYFDRSFTLNSVRGVVVLISAKGDRPLYIIRLNFCATNIVAECEALVNALRMATELRIHRLYIRGESKVIVN
jgi:ribonuclease HI